MESCELEPEDGLLPEKLPLDGPPVLLPPGPLCSPAPPLPPCMPARCRPASSRSRARPFHASELWFVSEAGLDVWGKLSEGWALSADWFAVALEVVGEGV
jgi:hypothetical protein